MPVRNCSKISFKKYPDPMCKSLTTIAFISGNFTTNAEIFEALFILGIINNKKVILRFSEVL
jgi:hypothetical protein